MIPLTYLDFLAVFVLLPMSLLTVAGVVRHSPDRPSGGVQAGGLAVVIALALAYTIPWDNHLIATGVWEYGDGTVWARIWYMPVGEYLFVVLQSVLVGLWTFQRDGTVDATIGQRRVDQLTGAAGGVAVTAAGVGLLLGPDSTYYIGAILAWGGPVLALQWAVGWRYLWAVRRRFAVLLAAPVIYLSTIDRIAIELGLWVLSPRYTTGVTVGGLPVEEGAFFLVTSLFIVQGLVLLRWVMARWG
jgi:lycopene cyclase domain-containing protein